MVATSLATARARVALVAALVLGGGAALRAQPVVVVSVEPSAVTVLDTFDILVSVRGNPGGEMSEPTIAADGFRILGSRQESQTSIINGRVSQSIQFRFTARPDRAGTLEIPPVTVVAGGRELTSAKGASIVVQDVVRRGDFYLELGVSRSRCYPWQEVTVTLEVCVERLPAPYADSDPSFDFRGTSTHLEVPWFEAQEGFSTDDVNTFAQALQPNRSGAGFTINSFVSRGFFDNDAIRFTLPRRAESRRGPDGVERPTLVYTLAKRFRAERAGRHVFGPVVARGILITAPSPGAQPSPQRFVARSEAATVEVLDVPAEGRPASYTGGVGKFSIAADVKTARPELFIGEPFTLRLTVRGEGDLERIGPVVLREQKAVAEGFRIPEESSIGEIDAAARAKTFVYSLRPRRAGQQVVPPIELAYFDPDAERFVTLATAPIPLDVREGKTVGAGDVESFDAAPFTRRHGAPKTITYPNYEKPDALIPRDPPRLLGPTRLTLLAAPPALYLALLLVTRARRRHAEDPGLRRARRALRRARAIAAEAGPLLSKGDLALGLEKLGEAITGLVGDRLDLRAEALTAADCDRALEARGAPAELRQTVREILERRDQSRYGRSDTGGETPEGLVARVHAVLVELDRRLAA